MLIRRAVTVVLSVLLSLLVFGCDTAGTESPASPSNAPTPHPGFTFPSFDFGDATATPPRAARAPLPQDILRDPTTGFNAFPSPLSPGTTEPFLSMNSIRGFSTLGNIIIPFTGTVQAATVTADTMPVFNTTTGLRVPCAYTVVGDTLGSTVIITPILPLADNTTHIVVVTQNVISGLSNSPVLSDNTVRLLKRTTPVAIGGVSQVTGLDDATAAILEPIRVAFQPIWTAAEGLVGTNRDNIPLAIGFTTQDLHATLPTLRPAATGDTPTLVNALVTPAPAPFPAGQFELFPHLAGPDLVPVVPTPPSPPFPTSVMTGMIPPVAGVIMPPIPSAQIHRIYAGRVSVPNYISNPLNGPWASPPVNSGNVNVPFLACYPNPAGINPTTMNPIGPGPYPVVIFQHGITGDRTNMFAMANAYCAQGFVVISIDLVLHGPSAATVAAGIPQGLNGDFVNNTTTQPPGGDGLDPSGANFINLANLRMSRDNIRQSVVNLFYLTDAIMNGRCDLDGNGMADLAPNVRFIGMSLGGIVGTVFVANEPSVTRAVLNVPGGRLSQLLVDSPTFSPSVLAGLAAQGVTPGTSAFVQFFLIAQTVVDDADPANYSEEVLTGALAGGTATQVLVQEMIGDAVVPNSATTDLVHAFTLAVVNPLFTQVRTVVLKPLLPQGGVPFMGSGLFQINNPSHSAFLLPPTGAPTLTGLIQTQAATFLLTGAIVDPGLPRDGGSGGDAEPIDADHYIYFGE